jgi:hypothetical protein
MSYEEPVKGRRVRRSVAPAVSSTTNALTGGAFLGRKRAASLDDGPPAPPITARTSAASYTSLMRSPRNPLDRQNDMLPIAQSVNTSARTSAPVLSTPMSAPDQVLKSDNRPTTAQRQDGIIPRSIISTDPVSSNPGGTNGPSTAPFQQAVPAQHTQLAKRPAASRTQFSSLNEWRLGDEFDPNAQAMQRQQLNMYGFHKRVDPSDNSMKASERKNKSPSEYYNPHFKRGHPNLLRLIQRKRNNPALHGIHYAASQEHVVFQIPAFAQHLETHPSSSSTGYSSRRALRKNASASVVAMVRLQARQMQEVNTKDQLAVDMPPLTSEQQAELSSERNASSSITNYAIGVVQSHGALVPTSVGISNSTGVETFGCEPSKDPTSIYVDLRRNSNTPVSTGKTNFYTLDTNALRKPSSRHHAQDYKGMEGHIKMHICHIIEMEGPRTAHPHRPAQLL